MKKLMIMCVFIVGISFISGCIGPDKSENAIIGQWKEIDGAETIEFYKDGTISIVGDISVSGDYKFIDDNTIRVDLGFVSLVAKISVSNDELILTEPDGEVSKYKRVDNTKAGNLLNKNEKTNNIEIQNELKTPEGIIVKISLIERSDGSKSIEGLVENPTTKKFEYVDAGILVQYVDEFDFDKNTVWNQQSGIFQTGLNTIVEPRHFLPLDYKYDRPIPDSTIEIKPYIFFSDGSGTLPLAMYPACFQGDPRQECYETKYVQGEGYVKIPKY